MIVLQKVLLMVDENVKRNSVRAWLLASRPKTLAAAVVPVVIGSALAYKDNGFCLTPAILCLSFAVLMQISANFINDLFDYLKGSDGEERLGPLRATSQGWISVPAMKIGIAMVVVLGCILGLMLVPIAGYEIVFVGVFCVLFAYFYTSGPFPLSYNGLGDVSVVLFFGLIAVGFTYYVQTLNWTLELTVLSLATGFVVNTLLVVNNYRDIDNDRKSGKRTLIVVLGEKFGLALYFFSGFIAFLLSVSVLMFSGKWASLLLLIYLGLHISAWYKMKNMGKGRQLNKMLGITSANMMLFSVLLTLGIVL